MKNEEVRHIIRCETVVCLVCNQQDLVAESEFYRKSVGGGQNMAGSGQKSGC